MEQEEVDQILKNRHKVFARCVKQWGEPMQLLMVLEETSELNSLVAKSIRGRNVSINKIAEEVADSLNLIEQLIYMYKFQDKVDEIRAEKLKRILNKAIDSEMLHEMRT